MQLSRRARGCAGVRSTCTSGSALRRPVGRLSSGSRLVRRAQEEGGAPGQPVATDNGNAPSTSGASGGGDIKLDKELTKFTRSVAGTMAPRSSTAKKNPAVKGTALYNVFEYQAWVAMVVGGLLSFNVLFPTDDPSIPRLMGMWSIWMFTIPSLRARECTAREKDALNLLFLLVPLLNVAIPFAAKSFPLIFAADVMAVGGVYAWKGVWREVYGLPLGPELTAAAGGSGSGEQP